MKLALTRFPLFVLMLILVGGFSSCKKFGKSKKFEHVSLLEESGAWQFDNVASSQWASLAGAGAELKSNVLIIESIEDSSCYTGSAQHTFNDDEIGQARYVELKIILTSVVTDGENVLSLGIKGFRVNVKLPKKMPGTEEIMLKYKVGKTPTVTISGDYTDFTVTVEDNVIASNFIRFYSTACGSSTSNSADMAVHEIEYIGW